MKEGKTEGTGSQRNWLKRVAEQSWEPELLISGLAIYATSQLPDILKSGLEYYTFNLQSGVGFFDQALPLTIYGSFTTALEFLNFAFILHFVIRAFWVGLIGLNSVFDKGIQYEKLEYSNFYKNEVKKRIGNSEDFLIAVDRLASVIFSIAFAVVLMLISISFMYFVFFMLINVMKVFLSESAYEIYSDILYITLLVIILSAALLSLILNMKRFRENEKIARFHFRLTWGMSLVIFPFILKPIQYLLLTYMSNMPLKKYIGYMGVFFVFFFAMMLRTSLTEADDRFFDARDYYTTLSTSGNFVPEQYESELIEGIMISEPVISSPVIQRGEFMSLFIPYSKLLDSKLDGFCRIEEPADSLFRFEKRDILNREYLSCANSFFTLLVNERDTVETDLLFTEHRKTEQPGYQSFLHIDDRFVTGKNILHIKRASVDKADAHRDSLGRPLIFESKIPLWVKD